MEKKSRKRQFNKGTAAEADEKANLGWKTSHSHYHSLYIVIKRAETQMKFKMSWHDLTNMFQNAVTGW